MEEEQPMSLTDSERRDLKWRKARMSGANGACVEVATTLGRIAVRDSKDPEGPVLIYTRAEWEAFLDGAKNGEFDNLI
jgi:hypothetical protein